MRKSNPLAFYALLEGLIAITVGLSPWLIDASRAVYIDFGGQMALGAFGAAAVRLALSAFILLAPTLLMGGTLPAAVAAATTPEDENRRAAAILYGVNTVGAVGGAMASTFLMLPTLGTRFTLWSACMVNVGVSTGAWFLSRHRVVTATPAAPLAKPSAKKKSAKERKPASRRRRGSSPSDPRVCGRGGGGVRVHVDGTGVVSHVGGHSRRHDLHVRLDPVGCVAWDRAGRGTVSAVFSPQTAELAESLADVRSGSRCFWPSPLPWGIDWRLPRRCFTSRTGWAFWARCWAGRRSR